MVLANGQYQFSCDGSGSYALNIPLADNVQFKLPVYADTCRISHRSRSTLCDRNLNPADWPLSE
jgi:hypothetical protein